MAFVDPFPVHTTPLTRPATTLHAPSEDTSFLIKPGDKSYKHQYSNIYFVRLHTLRKYVEQRAKKRWGEIAGDPVFVPRVLDVEKGRLCFIIGTVYMDMPLKPNVLEDIARDRSIPAPPPREKYHSENDSVMLEDESGRVCLVGDRISSACLVTGVILGALGIETNSGDFEVVDLCYPGMAPQLSASLPWSPTKVSDESMDTDDVATDSDEWVALVSGLEVGAMNAAEGPIQMLVEYLAGEAGGLDDQSRSARISRLIIAGNSLGPIQQNSTSAVSGDTDRKSRKHGQEASVASHPTQNLAAHLMDVCRSIPVHLLPGPSDPAATILPQQPLPRAMLGGASHYASFSCESNPSYITVARARDPGPSTSRASQPQASTSKARANGASDPNTPEPTRTILVHSGQPLDDMFKYVPTPPISRMTLAQATLRWRHIAPTAPDTLWCHPYFQKDPFVIPQTPDIYVVGNQPAFATKLIEEHGDADVDDDAEVPKKCRIILVPKFRESGVLVLVNLRTLAVRRVQFAVDGMCSGGADR